MMSFIQEPLTFVIKKSNITAANSPAPARILSSGTKKMAKSLESHTKNTVKKTPKHRNTKHFKYSKIVNLNNSKQFI